MIRRAVNFSAVLAGGVGMIAAVLGVRLTVLPAMA